MRLEAEDQQFISHTLPTIQGWLLNDSAMLTSAMLRWQHANGVSGGVFEIGVFAGKFLSLLYHLTQKTGENVLGLDTFQWYRREKVEEDFKRVFDDSDRLRLWAGDSTRIKPEEVVSKLGDKPRFISVDGAHTAGAVLNDLKICEAILAPGGIVAIDDIFNPHAIGVSEGAYRYFLNPKGAGLAPFAYSENELYAAHADEATRLNEAIWLFTRCNSELRRVIEFNKLLENGRDWVEQKLFGFPVVIL